MLLFSVQPTQYATAQASPFERLDPGYTPPDAPPESEPFVDGATTRVAPVTQALVTISGIRFNGVDVPEPVAEAAGKFIGRPADTETLKSLAASMSEAYRRSEVALFTLAIPEQDLAGGVVNVYVAEGRVTQVLTLRGRQPLELPRLTAYFDPALEENPTTRATFERSLMLARRTSGLTITPALQTAPEPGGVVVVLDTAKKKEGITVGYDSRQSQLVDSGRIGVSTNEYDVWREGDAARARLSVTPDGEQIRTASAQYATPVGTDGLALGLGASYQQTRPDGMPIEGDAFFVSASLAYPVLLDFRREWSVSAELDRTESTNTALGSVFANERISALRLGTKYVWSNARRSASLGLTYSRGIDIDESRTSVPGASPAFSRTGLSANALQIISPRLRLRLRGTAQWSGRALPANERLAIGGAEFGRGFDNALLSLDRGYAVLVEPAFRPISSGPFANSEIYVFADHADGIVSPGLPGERAFELGSAGFGTRIVYKELASLGLEIADPWKVPTDGMDDDPIVTVSWSLRYQR